MIILYLIPVVYWYNINIDQSVPVSSMKISYMSCMCLGSPEVCNKSHNALSVVHWLVFIVRCTLYGSKAIIFQLIAVLPHSILTSTLTMQHISQKVLISSAYRVIPGMRRGSCNSPKDGCVFLVPEYTHLNMFVGMDMHMYKLHVLA